MEAHSDNLALFYKPPKDKSVIFKEWVEHRPVGELSSDGALEFNISGNSNRYIDLMKTRVKMKVRILQGDGKVLPPAAAGVYPKEAKVGPVNLFLQSMFSQVDVSLDQQVVSPNISSKYCYKALFEVLLNYGQTAQESKLQSQLYSKDEGGLDAKDPISGTNAGLILRAGYFEKSQTVDMEGPVYVDICQQNRYIPNGVQINFKFWPSSNKFKFMSSNDKADYKLDIKEAILKVYTVELSRAVSDANNLQMMKTPATYFYDRTDMKTFAIAKGQYGCSLEDLFQGVVPSELVVGLVESSAYMGDYTKNPYFFDHMNLSSIALYIDGRSHPSVPITPKFKETNYVSAYMSLFGGDYDRNEGIIISRDNYGKGYALYKFETCENYCTEYTKETRRGHTRLELKFSEALAKPTTVILAAKFPGQLEIDGERRVHIKSTE